MGPSTMVAFATIFLGLVLGPQLVEVAVDGPVATLELRLDGDTVATRSRPPWLFVIDFGSGYEPHVLEAVALDEQGEEVSRAEQWLNVPRQEVEAEIVLTQGDRGSGVVAQVLWESRVEAEPREILVTFDGRPVEFEDPERIPLPPHDPEQLHLLQVELRFRGDYSATVEKTFGGTYTDEVDTQLTAIPIVLPRGGRSPAPADLQGRFVGGDGEPLRVMAIDEGPAEVFVVRGGQAQELLGEITARRGMRPHYSLERYSGRLRRNQVARFLYPVTVELIGHRTRQEQFPTSRAFSPDDGGLAWLMIQERRPFPRRHQRLSEAVAVAGMAAALRNRRRAVLFVVSSDPTDVSRIGPAVARQYLSHLRVPLFVWAVGDKRESGDWGPQRPISTVTDLHAATRDLARSLERQRIVWLRGRHLPQRITLLEPSDFRLAR